MIPRMMKYAPKPLRLALAHIGRRGLFLLFWAFLWMSTGYRWVVRPPTTETYHYLFQILGPQGWGITFMVMAVIMAAGGIIKRLDGVAFAVSAYVAGLLGLATLVSAFQVPAELRGATFTVVATYFLYTFFVLIVSGWPEAPILVEKTRDGP